MGRPDCHDSGPDLGDRSIGGLGDVHRRAVEPPEWIIPITRVLFDASHHLRMSSLDEQRADPADERRRSPATKPSLARATRIAHVLESVFERFRAVENSDVVEPTILSRTAPITWHCYPSLPATVDTQRTAAQTQCLARLGHCGCRGECSPFHRGLHRRCPPHGDETSRNVATRTRHHPEGKLS